ncbi:hypothetical protein BUALT_Bualt16G0022900 [Buddleja alternifolia]|uniref:FCP1 homology domain-containing protein n=1 Tax=Buddleja alternifolia TaxID=168488 RepID=A0AAV6W9Z2_9LAMI|nr:hypothetical protein BUALT_Bualt16G0022900 [Buddleja alternifolia]
MDATCTQIPAEDSSKKSKSSRRKERSKKKALEKNGSDPMDSNLEASDIIRDCNVANNELNGNLLETDLTVKPLAEHPKVDTSSMEKISEGNSSIKKKKRKKNKKKTEIKNEVQSMDQINVDTGLTENLAEANSESNGNVLETGLTVKPLVEHPKVDTSSMEKISEGNSSIKKKKRKNNKKKTEIKDEGQSMDQINVDTGLIENLAEANSESKGNLLETDLTVKPLAEHPKVDTSSMEKTSEGNSSIKKKKRKRNKKKTEIKDVVQTMDPTNVDTGLIENLTETNSESNGNLLETGLTVEPLAEHKVDTSSMEKNSEGNSSLKKKKRKKNNKKKKMTEIKDEVQSMDQINVDTGLTENLAEANTESNGNVLETGLTVKPLAEHPKVDTSSMEKISEGNSSLKKKKGKKNKNKTKIKDEVQSMDQINVDTGSIENLAEANNESNWNLLETDLAVNPLPKHPKVVDTSSMEKMSEGNSSLKKKKAKKNKNKTQIKNEVQSMDQINVDTGLIENLAEANDESNGNLLETDLTMEPLAEYPKVDTSSMEKINEGNSSTKKKKGKKNKKKTEIKDEVQSMGQINVDTGLIENLAEANVTGQKKRKRKNLKKAKIKDEIQGMNLAGSILNLHLSDVNHGQKIDGELRNDCADEEYGLCHSDHNMDNPSGPSSNLLQDKENPLDLLKHEAVLLSGVDQRNVDTGLENLAEENVTGKRKRKSKKLKKAKIKDEIQSINLAGSILNLHLSDVNHGQKIDGKLRNDCADKEYGLCYNDHNMDNPSVPSSNLVQDTENPLDMLKDEAILLSGVDQINVDTGLIENLPEANMSDERKRERKKLKKAKIKDEIQSMNLAGSIVNLHLSDLNHGRKIDGELRNDCADKEYGLFHSDHIMDNPSVSSSNLVQDTENPLGLLKHEESVLSSDVVEVSSSKSPCGLVEERCGPLARSMESKGKLLPCESQCLPHPNLAEGHNGRFENGLTEVNDEVILYQGKCSAEGRSVFSTCNVKANTIFSSCGVKDAEYSSPKTAPIASVRRKLLVLDLNGLLADIVMGPIHPREDAHILGRAVFKRPFYGDFLKFCFQNFDVAIWSSRTKRIIDQVVDYLLGDLKNKLLFCWDMSYATQTGFNTLENKHKPLVCKELKKIWENDDPNSRWKKGDYNESNTLLLDDSPYKALLNPPHTAIFPHSFHYGFENDNSLGPGGDLRVYLEGLVNCENVQKYVEQHPFGQRAITEKTLTWRFYAGVLHKMSEQSKDKTPVSLPTLS